VRVVSAVRSIILSLLLPLFIVVPSPAAQTGAARAKLMVTVSDPSGAVIPDATVTIVGLDDTLKSVTIAPAKTGTNGTATFDGLTPGRYSIKGEFEGFDLGLLRDVRVNRGDNKHMLVLPLKNMTESVTVGGEGQAAANRASRAFGLNLTDDQIQNLSDDPAELQRQLSDVAGPDAVFRVDSFEGQQLPPKAQIKSIHVTRDQFAAETEQPGSTFVDVITQPGIGPVRGTGNFSFRDSSMSARSQFTPTKADEQFRGYGLTIGGALVKEKSNFSLSVNGQNNYSTPNLNVALPNGQQRFDVLRLRQPFDRVDINGLVDYALTRDQTLRFGYSENHNSFRNQGIGAYDLPERAFTSTNNGYTFRALEAGPIGRRMFINTRATMTWRDFGSESAIEAPTIVVQDAFTSGGAQHAGRVHGRNMTLASDLDYVHGINSWRSGIQMYGDWYHATLNNNYLGTYTFSSLEAYEAGTPILYTRSLGDPTLDFFHMRLGAYVQDDIRIKKGLTLSPGVRYSYQTQVDDPLAFEPRVGITWAPWANGKTTLRASGGIFHGWLDPGIWWQTVRSDSTHQRDVIITNPSYPDPGPGGLVSPANTYRLGNYKLNKNYRYSAGVDQRFSPRASVNLLYNYYNQSQLPRGMNLNPVVDGVRPDPNYGNIIATVVDAELHRHELYANFAVNLLAPAASSNRSQFNWRRLAANGGYSLLHARRNALGPFDVPASGTLDTEWGRGPADNPYRINVTMTSTQLRNLAVAFTINASDGYVYMETTGHDDNGDGLLNDRPAGIGLWSLRTPPTWTGSLRLTYSLFGVPGGPGAGGAAAQRYKLSFYAAINNLTNHANLVGFSGVMTSPFFMTATGVQNPRKVDIGMNVSF